MSGLKPIVKRPTYDFELQSERKSVKVGRGFSRSELKKAGLTVEQAKKFKIPIDLRRKTVYEDNLNMLKKFLEEQKKGSTSSSESSNTQPSNKS